MKLPKSLFWANETLAFVLELIALYGLGWWGYHLAGGGFGGVVLAIVFPLIAAVLWGAFASPRAKYKIPFAAIMVVKAVVFGAGAIGFAVVGHGVSAIVFAVVALVNTVLAEANRPLQQVEVS
ncbi:YrdB family protein [Nocardia sp. NPDC020380]|uniref:YrdB family protein n=1 Tax=Nocardia sp. NPDC020380 TaxID=3364309 RepID=UPI003795048F